MTKRLFWHVGTPKSGTTYLQSVLRNNADRLAAAGVLVAGETHLDLVRSGMAVREDARLASLPPHAQESWSRVVQQIRKWPGDSVLSYELFAGASPAQIESAMALFEDHEVHVLVTARELGTLVPSAWQERLKFGLTTSLEDWEPRPEDAGPSAQWSWRTLDAASVGERWSAALSDPARLHLITVPADAAPEELWRRFAEAVSLRLDDVDLVVERANESLTPARAEVLRRVNELVGDQITTPREASVWLRDTLAHRVLARGGGERLGLQDEQYARLATRSDRIVDRIAAAGWTIHGDLEDLKARRLRGRGPREVSEKEVAGIAVEATAALLLELRSRGQREDGAGDATPRPERLRARAKRYGIGLATSRLRRRIEALETQVQQERRLHLKVAELEDLVAELLLPTRDQGDEVVRRALHRYRRNSL